MRILTILEDPHKSLGFKWLLTANVSAIIMREGKLSMYAYKSFDVT
jgi:hypothetical protein